MYIKRLIQQSLLFILTPILMTLLPGISFAQTDFADTLKEASVGKQFVQPSRAEIQRAEALFARLFNGERSTALNAAWAEAGFDVLSADSGQLTLVVEQASQRAGRGFFVLRAGLPVMLQMPHAFKDELTREIGVSVFKRSQFSAAAWNTVPRKYEQNGQVINADMAHLTNTYFIAFSRAFARHYPQGNIVQLHGFDQSKRSSSTAAFADVIMSNGSGNASPLLKKLAVELQQKTKFNILVYPDDVRELGATTNTVAADLRDIGFTQFTHIEMSRGFRERLKRSRTWQLILVNSLGAAN